MNNQTLRDNAAGLAITRNPGVAMLWITREYEVFRADNNGGYLIQMGDPETVEWWASGRLATREEVLDSIYSGLPNLERIAKTEVGGMEALERYKERFMKFVPA